MTEMTRTAHYPEPPVKRWSGIMVVTYLSVAIAGLLVLAALVLIPQTGQSVVVLGLWGVSSLVAGLLSTFGVVKNRYRYEWMGDWLVVLGTLVYLLVTVVGTASQGLLALFTSAPTMLVFVFGIGLAAGRAVWLSSEDMKARKRVRVERELSTLTGEMPEVRPDEP